MTRSLARVALALGLALLSGCSGGSSEGPFQLPGVNWAGLPLPKTPEGNFVAIQIADAAVEINPFLSDPLTGLGACTDLVTYCYADGELSLDGCVSAVPRCATARPWEEQPCCPSACADEYAERRASVDAFAAFEATFFSGGTPCYPGVQAALEGR